MVGTRHADGFVMTRATEAFIKGWTPPLRVGKVFAGLATVPDFDSKETRAKIADEILVQRLLDLGLGDHEMVLNGEGDRLSFKLPIIDGLGAVGAQPSGW